MAPILVVYLVGSVIAFFGAAVLGGYDGADPANSRDLEEVFFMSFGLAVVWPIALFLALAYAPFWIAMKVGYAIRIASNEKKD